MNYVTQAKELLKWNTINLIHDSALNKADLQLLFAEKFEVKANGRHYDANYDNYYDFLNKFRADIKSISYRVHEYIAAGNYVTMPLTAHIARTNDAEQDFEAILILKFDGNGKIILWHEVYLELRKE